MKKIKLEILGLSSSQSEIGHFALVLGEEGGARRLPIIIDGYQARSIALEIEKIRPNRPMTHDLFVSLAQQVDVVLNEVVISELNEGIFYSRLVFSQGSSVFELDSRTSDAVALAVRFDVPIYTYEAVLSVAGIEMNEGTDLEDELGTDELEDELEDLELEEEEVEEESFSKMGSAQKIKRLHEQIGEAIANEEYEKAAKLRDEINRIEAEEN